MAPWFTRELTGVACFVGISLCAAIAGAAYAGNAEFSFYIAVMFVLIGAVLVLHRRIGLSLGLLWALAVWGALHMAGGLVPVPESWPVHGEFRVLYSWWIVPKAEAVAGEPAGWLKYDQVVHAYGFGVTTWLCWEGLRGALAGYRLEGAALHPGVG